jgi:TusA-related sulfurtransferase/rhodanese-related sulfurtransferase
MEELEREVKNITIADFAKLNFADITILDLREPDEVLIKGFDGAINVPFSKISTGLDAVPNDKAVYIICRTGDFSEEVAEILADRGYDVYNVEGGYNAYADYIKKEKSILIDAKNLKCPGPIVKVADTIKNLRNGQRVLIEATEDAFYSDIKIWCDRTGNKLVDIQIEDNIIYATVEKSTRQSASKNSVTADNDKTFVVFSGDLDKTIAAFIMANGAAAMGRDVTMFFTFGDLTFLDDRKK